MARPRIALLRNLRRIELYTVSLNEAFTLGAANVGGKALTLARLKRYGFDVPRGFVVRAELSDFVLGSTIVSERLRRLPPVRDRDVTSRLLREALAGVREAIQHAPLPSKFRATFADSLRTHRLSHARCAVRSSAVLEDDRLTSFAGIHESYLEVSGIDALISAVRNCLTSPWSDRAVAYRQRFDIGDYAARIAVIVMEMINAEYGGLIFTADPQENTRCTVVISVGVGCPDATVLAKQKTETWRVDANKPHAPAERKARKINAVPTRGRSVSSILTPEMAVELAELALCVERALSHDDLPQDIEWARSGARICLLQSRPITALDDRLPVGISSISPMWSTANLKDASPNVQSPLGADLLRVLLRTIILAPFRAAGYQRLENATLSRIIGGRPYLNISALQWAYFECFGVHPRELNLGIGGFQPEIDVCVAGVRSRPRFLQRARLLMAALIAWLLFALARNRIGRLASARVPDNLASIHRTEIRGLLRRTAQGIQLAGVLFQLMNSLAGAAHATLRREIFLTGTDDPEKLARDLLAGTGGVESAVYVEYLCRLAAIVRRTTPHARDKIEIMSAIDDQLETSKDTEFKKVFKEMLAAHGHRAVYEMEIANPRWNEDPTYLLKNVAILCEHGAPERGSVARAVYANARAGLLSARSHPSRLRLLAVIKFARQTIRLRENAKSLLLLVAQPMRLLLLECGRRMRQAGALTEASDIFWCSWWDVSRWLADCGSAGGLARLVADRKLALKELQDRRPPDVIASPPIFRETGLVQVSQGSKLTGIGISAGRAEGVARYVEHPDQCERFQSGEILIAATSDPAWAPMFFRAAAVVLEMGGILSHGAILARELGIPAVANIEELRQLIQDGEWIVVDADLGEVTRLQGSRCKT